MNSRERIRSALKHNQTEILPVDFGATDVTGIHASVVSRLRDYYGLSNDPPVKIVEPYQMLGEIEDDLKQILGADCVCITKSRNIFGYENKDWKEWRLFDGTPVLVPGKFNTSIEKDGSLFQFPEGDRSAPPSAKMPAGGFFFDIIIRQEMIEEDGLKAEDNLEEFKIIDNGELDLLEDKANKLYKETGYSIVGSFGGTSFGGVGILPAPSLKHPKGIRDIQEWYLSLITRQDHILSIFNSQCGIALSNLKKINDAIGNKIDVIFLTGADFGTQKGPMISQDTYRKLFKPFHAKVNSWIHDNTAWKTFMHNCGGIRELIPDIIDAGFDILNPVQISASGMDPVELKKEFGKDIVFWGGGIDTQKTLALGSPGEVKKETEKLIDIFINDGGFVFNTVHNIQANVPIKNIAAMIEILQKYR